MKRKKGNKIIRARNQEWKNGIHSNNKIGKWKKTNKKQTNDEERYHQWSPGKLK